MKIIGKVFLFLISIVMITNISYSKEVRGKRKEPVQEYDPKPFDLSIEKLPINYEGHSVEKVKNLYPPEKAEFETVSSYMNKVEQVDTSRLYAFRISSQKSYNAEEEKMYVEVHRSNMALRPEVLVGKFPKYILPTIEGSGAEKEIDENYRYYVSTGEIANVVKQKYVGENVAGVKREIERVGMDSYNLQICNFKSIPSLPQKDKYGDYLTFSINMEGGTAKFNKNKLSILFISRLVNNIPIFKTTLYKKPTIDDPFEMLLTSFHIPIKVEQIWIYNSQTGQIFSKLSLKSEEK